MGPEPVPLSLAKLTAFIQVVRAERAKVVYSYDFGDDWRYDILVEKIVPAEPGRATTGTAC